MKNTFVKAFFALICIACVTMSSCGSQLVRITVDGESYIDRAGGVTYYGAPVSYEPRSVGAEYAQYGDTVLCQIGGLEPTQWLTEAYDGIGSVYYSSDIALPTLEQFAADKIYICVEDNLIMQIAKIEVQTDVNAVVDAFCGGESTDMPLSADTSYHLKFVSEQWYGIYYDVLYIEDSATGLNYIYDRGTKKCVEVGSLMEKYLPHDAATDETETSAQS